MTLGFMDKPEAEEEKKLSHWNNSNSHAKQIFRPQKTYEQEESSGGYTIQNGQLTITRMAKQYK